jgi:hypothetical protein
LPERYQKGHLELIKQQQVTIAYKKTMGQNHGFFICARGFGGKVSFAQFFHQRFCMNLRLQ